MVRPRHQRALELLAVSRHGETEREVDGGDEQVDLDTEPHPPRIDDDGLGGAEQIEQSDDRDERCLSGIDVMGGAKHRARRRTH